MTEAEWLTCTDPQQMLRFLNGTGPYDTAERKLRRKLRLRPVDDCRTRRKLRLFCCACCRRVWHLLTDQRSRRAVELAERCADGGATLEELDEASTGASAVHRAALRRLRQSGAARTGEAQAIAAYEAVCCLDRYEHYAVEAALRWHPDSTALLRCLFRNPFRRHPRLGRDKEGSPRVYFATASVVHQHWPVLRWNDGTVPKIAQAIYDERRFEDMPILADALEDAGCDNEEILRHCREPGEHARGCWVVDLLLGKE